MSDSDDDAVLSASSPRTTPKARLRVLSDDDDDGEEEDASDCDSHSNDSVLPMTTPATAQLSRERAKNKTDLEEPESAESAESVSATRSPSDASRTLRARNFTAVDRFVMFSRSGYQVPCECIVQAGTPLEFADVETLSAFVDTKSYSKALEYCPEFTTERVTILQSQNTTYYYYSCYVKPRPGDEVALDLARDDAQRLRHVTEKIGQSLDIEMRQHARGKLAEIVRTCNVSIKDQINPKVERWSPTPGLALQTAFVKPPTQTRIKGARTKRARAPSPSPRCHAAAASTGLSSGGACVTANAKPAIFSSSASLSAAGVRSCTQITVDDVSKFAVTTQGSVVCVWQFE